MKTKPQSTTTKSPRQKRATRRSAATAPAPTPTALEQTKAPAEACAPGGKLGILVELLSRPTGATIADLADATGWQDHSVRGALAGALKKRGYATTSKKVDRVRIYRLAETSREGARPAPARGASPTA